MAGKGFNKFGGGKRRRKKPKPTTKPAPKAVAARNVRSAWDEKLAEVQGGNRRVRR